MMLDWEITKPVMSLWTILSSNQGCQINMFPLFLQCIDPWRQPFYGQILGERPAEVSLVVSRFKISAASYFYDSTYFKSLGTKWLRAKHIPQNCGSLGLLLDPYPCSGPESWSSSPFSSFSLALNELFSASASSCCSSLFTLGQATHGGIHRHTAMLDLGLPTTGEGLNVTCNPSGSRLGFNQYNSICHHELFAKSCSSAWGLLPVCFQLFIYIYIHTYITAGREVRPQPYIRDFCLGF